MSTTPPSKVGSPGSLSPLDTPFGQFKDNPVGLSVRPPGESRDRRASSVSFQTGAPLNGFMALSNPSTPRSSNVGLGGSSPGSNHLSAGSAPKSNLNVYRNSRDAYYKHFELSAAEQSDGVSPRRIGGDLSCEARCHQLASAALALSYLIADLRETKGRIPTMRVTYEDLIVSLQLPLQYATHNHLTFHQLHSIIKRFVQLDERFKDEYEVIATTFDTRRTDGSIAGLTLVEEETGRRASVMSATELRSTISDDGLTFDRVKIACYDAELVVADNVIEVDESELQSNELLNNVIGDGVRAVGESNDDMHRRPSTHSGCSVIADIQRSKNEVHLLQVHSIEPFKVRRVDVPLKTLHDALSARNPDSQRAQGIIEIRKKDSHPDVTSEGLMGVSIGIEGNNYSKILFGNGAPGAPQSPRKPIETIFGADWQTKATWDEATSPKLEFYDFTIGEHVLTTAVALHLLDTKRFLRIDVNGIVTALNLPAASLRSGGALHALQWYSMLQSVCEKHQLHVEYLPFCRHVRKAGSTPFVSVAALSEFFKEVVAMNSDDPQNRAVVLLSFHGGKARNSLNYFRAQENTISYAIVAGFDAKTEQVVLIDCDIKRNEVEWTIAIDELHAAMTDHGLLVLCEPPAAKKVQSILPALDAYGESQRKMAKYHVLDLPTVAVGDVLSIPAPLALCSLALKRISKIGTTIDEMLHSAPCNFSHALFPHPSLFDVARLFNAVHRAVDDVVATYHSLSVDRMLKKKTSSTAFASLLKTHLDDGAQIVVHFSRFLLPNSPHWEGQHCPNYALIVAQAANDMLLLCDTNEAPENRLFQVSVHDLFKACEDTCAVSRRPRGLVVIARDAVKAKMIRTERSRFPNLHFATPTCHAFRSAGPPQIVAAAMAITALGYPTRPSLMYYAALAGDRGEDDACTRTLRPLARVRRTLTIASLVELTNRYLEGAKLPLQASLCAGSSRQGHLTREDLKAILKHHTLHEEGSSSSSSSGNAGKMKPTDSALEKEVYVGVYDAKQAHDIAGEFCGAGVLLGYDDATSEAVVLNAEPSTWGDVWRSTLTSALECLVKDPDDIDREHFGVMRIYRKEGGVDGSTTAEKKHDAEPSERKASPPPTPKEEKKHPEAKKDEKKPATEEPHGTPRKQDEKKKAEPEKKAPHPVKK